MRTPSGRLSRTVEAQCEHVEPVARRAARHGLNLGEAMDQKAATVVGRMALKGTISESQYLAAGLYLKAWQAQLRAIRAPGEGIGGPDANGGEVPSTEAYERWCHDAIARWSAARLAVQNANAERGFRGHALLAALDQLVLHDREMPHLVEAAGVALHTLVGHYGLTPGGRRA